MVQAVTLDGEARCYPIVFVVLNEAVHEIEEPAWHVISWGLRLWSESSRFGSDTCMGVASVCNAGSDKVEADNSLASRTYTGGANRRDRKRSGLDQSQRSRPMVCRLTMRHVVSAVYYPGGSSTECHRNLHARNRTDALVSDVPAYKVPPLDE